MLYDEFCAHRVVTATSSHHVRQLAAEIAKFGTVGIIAYVVDVGLFNLLVFGGGHGVLHDKPLTAKSISTIVAMAVSYLGNRQWTFRARGTHGFLRESAMFVAVNIVALAITLLPLALSRYVLGLTGPLADNIAANLLGVGLGTLFRFWAYRSWVFPHTATSSVKQPVQTDP